LRPNSALLTDAFSSLRGDGARAHAMRKSRSGRRRTRGTSLLPETWPDAPLRIRRLLGLPCEPGRGLCQGLALGLELLVLTTQLDELLALRAA
jgi:hypothetical protein